MTWRDRLKFQTLPVIAVGSLVLLLVAAVGPILPDVRAGISAVSSPPRTRFWPFYPHFCRGTSVEICFDACDRWRTTNASRTVKSAIVAAADGEVAVEYEGVAVVSKTSNPSSTRYLRHIMHQNATGRARGKEIARSFPVQLRTPRVRPPHLASSMAGCRCTLSGILR